ncbi:MAG: hypothetical protein AB1744_02925 [Candidatus Zixiibacteriota bacterium]
MTTNSMGPAGPERKCGDNSQQSGNNLPLVEHEGEPRVRDVVLGKKLGMKRPTNIRQQIEKHREVLERFGGVCTQVVQTSKKGGKPGGTEYLLNEEQAVYIVTQSDAPNALETKVQVVKVFVAWRHGHLAPVSDALTAKETGGIVKAVLNKRIGALEKEVEGIGQAVIAVAREVQAQGRMLEMMARALEEQDAHRERLAEEVRSLVVAADPRHTATDYVAPLDIAIREGVPPKRRQQFVKVMGDQMAKISADWEVPVRLSKETGKRLFSPFVADYWLNHGGRDRITAHKSKVVGQGVLRLVPRRPSKPTDGELRP